MRNKIIIQKMIKYTEKILVYCEGINYKIFRENEILFEACVFNLSQLGELAGKLDDDFKVSYRFTKNILSGHSSAFIFKKNFLYIQE